VAGGGGRPPSYLLSIFKLLENPQCVKDLAEPMNSTCQGAGSDRYAITVSARARLTLCSLNAMARDGSF